MLRIQGLVGGLARPRTVAVAVIAVVVIGVLVAATLPKPGCIRIRYFNGHGSNGVKVKLQAYLDKQGQQPGPSTTFVESEVVGHAYSVRNFNQCDYPRFDLWLADANGNFLPEPTASFVADTIAGEPGSFKIGTFFVCRRGTAAAPKHTVIVTYLPMHCTYPMKAHHWDEP